MADFGELDDKIKGIIFGAALGDAVGLATEFMNKNTAKMLYGNGPIKFGLDKGHEFWRDRHRGKWFENDFTDDTDQLLLILQCLLHSKGNLIPQHFAYRLSEWTKIGFPELKNKMACGVGYTVGSTLGHPEFLTNPHKAAYQIWDTKGKNLAANGAVMRTAVLGIPFFWDETKVVENAINCAKVTHADPRSIFSSVVTSVIISRLLRNTLGVVNPKLQDLPDLNQDLVFRVKMIKLLESGAGENLQDVEVEQLKPKEIVLDIGNDIDGNKTNPVSFFSRVKNVFNKNKEPKLCQISNWPDYKEPDESRLKKHAPKIQKGFSLNACTVDNELNSLCSQVIDDYKFILGESKLLCSDESVSSSWEQDMEKYCLNMEQKKIEDFELDEPRSIGYTYKCLGSALHCFTKEIPEKMSKDNFFKEIITSLTLEAGDSDTNAAVAGALLGCRFGFSKLPKEWTKELRHFDFLDNISNELIQIVYDSYKTSK